MVKIKISIDERYPEFVVREDGIEIEVTSEEFVRLVKANVEYDWAQRLMKERTGWHR